MGENGAKHLEQSRDEERNIVIALSGFKCL